MLCVLGVYMLFLLLFPGTAGQLTARLVNGTHYSGRLEILYNGTWSTVCDDNFGNNDARVVCRMLGFFNPGAVAVSSDMYGAGQGSILLDDVDCRGSESNLGQCLHLGYYSHDCKHSEDVGIICNIPGQLTARIVNGTHIAGRLEILYNGTWSTVCDDYFNDAAAQVACRMMGFNSLNVQAVHYSVYGAGEGTFLLDDVNCTGTETSLAQCSHSEYYNHNCYHYEDVGVICNTQGVELSARLVSGTQWSGRLEILFNGMWGGVCDDHFENVDAQVACRMLGFNSPGAVAVSSMYGLSTSRYLLDDVNCRGTETNLNQCSHAGYYRHNCRNYQHIGIICNIPGQLTARLVNGTNSSGRLEILYNGTWSTVCDDGFNTAAAQVACRMLGFNFNSSNPLAVSNAVYGAGQGTILLDNVRCKGTETSLAHCFHNKYYKHDCQHSEDVGVVCSTSAVEIYKLRARLVNGTNYSGRLEILFNGTWSTVCDDGFNTAAAQVACRMLGFNSSNPLAVSHAVYGASQGTILLDETNCTGTETSLAQCFHRGYYTHDCQHYEDVGVVCSTSKGSQLKARLVNGTQWSGRLEILYNGAWSTVCDDYFDNVDAQVACRMLGFDSPGAVAVLSNMYGAGEGSILLGEVKCLGTETNLEQCAHPGYYRHNCDHKEDIGIICNNTGQLTARLVNGTYRAGRLEILYNGTWSTVCDDGFYNNDALLF